MAIAPWLDVQPSQFLSAAEAGGSAGINIAKMLQDHAETAQRLQMAREQAAMEQQKMIQEQQKMIQEQRANAAAVEANRQKMAQEAAQNAAANRLSREGHDIDLLKSYMSEAQTQATKEMEQANKERQFGLDERTLAMNQKRYSQPKLVKGANGAVYSYDPELGTTEALVDPNTDSTDFKTREKTFDFAIKMGGATEANIAKAKAFLKTGDWKSSVPVAESSGEGLDPSGEGLDLSGLPASWSSQDQTGIGGVATVWNPTPAPAIQPPAASVPRVGDVGPQGIWGGGGWISTPTSGTGANKVATRELIQSLKDQGMDKVSAAQWLQDNGYSIQ